MQNITNNSDVEFLDSEKLVPKRDKREKYRFANYRRRNDSSTFVKMHYREISKLRSVKKELGCFEGTVSIKRTLLQQFYLKIDTTMH